VNGIESRLPGLAWDVRKLLGRRSGLLFVIQEVAMLEDTVDHVWILNESYRFQFPTARAHQRVHFIRAFVILHLLQELRRIYISTGCFLWYYCTGRVVESSLIVAQLGRRAIVPSRCTALP
jgi:hypothetical protein